MQQQQQRSVRNLDGKHLLNSSKDLSQIPVSWRDNHGLLLFFFFCDNWPRFWSKHTHFKHKIRNQVSRHVTTTINITSECHTTQLTYISTNLLVVYRESVNLIGYLTRRLSADSLQLWIANENRLFWTRDACFTPQCTSLAAFETFELPM